MLDLFEWGGGVVSEFCRVIKGNFAESLQPLINIPFSNVAVEIVWNLCSKSLLFTTVCRKRESSGLHYISVVAMNSNTLTKYRLFNRILINKFLNYIEKLHYISKIVLNVVPME